MSAQDELASLWRELQLEPEQVAELESARTAANAHARSTAPDAAAAARLAEVADRRIARTGAFVLELAGLPEDAALARVRNALWPAFHTTSLVRVGGGRATRRTQAGEQTLACQVSGERTLLVAHRRAYVQSPEATVEKFDKNAAGWNGLPGKPGYAHFRWMRRFVGRFALPAPGQRVLDFGCGAGWCGIESVQGIADVELCAFDPSPELVRIAAENARSSGVARFAALTGFGDAPPFPRAGEEPFDLVISSGVVSFAPDVDAFLAGLARTVKSGGTLVIGDINRESRGMQRRRATKPLLPVREMNALTAREIRAQLEARGFRHLETAGYQLTSPVPEAMHFSDRKLKGLASPVLLAANRALATLDRRLGNSLSAQFDSWVMRLVAP